MYEDNVTCVGDQYRSWVGGGGGGVRSFVIFSGAPDLKNSLGGGAIFTMPKKGFSTKKKLAWNQVVCLNIFCFLPEYRQLKIQAGGCYIIFRKGKRREEHLVGIVHFVFQPSAKGRSLWGTVPPPPHRLIPTAARCPPPTVINKIG